MASKKLPDYFDHDGSERGKQILERVRKNLKSALWKSGAIRQALAPEAALDVVDLQAIASRALPAGDILRRHVLSALRDETGWDIGTGDLNAAVARWLRQELKACLQEVWTSRLRVKIRVTRHEISVVSIDGRFSPNVGSLP